MTLESLRPVFDLTPARMAFWLDRIIPGSEWVYLEPVGVLAHRFICKSANASAIVWLFPDNDAAVKILRPCGGSIELGQDVPGGVDAIRAFARTMNATRG